MLQCCTYRNRNSYELEDHLLPDTQTMEEVFSLEEESLWRSPRGIYAISAMLDY